MVFSYFAVYVLVNNTWVDGWYHILGSTYTAKQLKTIYYSLIIT